MSFCAPHSKGWEGFAAVKLNPREFWPCYEIIMLWRFWQKCKDKCTQLSQGFSLDMALLGRERSWERTCLLSEQSFNDIALSSQEHL